MLKKVVRVRYLILGFWSSVMPVDLCFDKLYVSIKSTQCCVEAKFLKVTCRRAGWLLVDAAVSGVKAIFRGALNACSFAREPRDTPFAQADQILIFHSTVYCNTN